MSKVATKEEKEYCISDRYTYYCIFSKWGESAIYE